MIRSKKLLRPTGARQYRAVACAALMMCASSASAAGCSAGPLVRLRAPGGDVIATVAPQHGGELVGLEILRRHRWVQLLYRGMEFCPTTGWDGKAPILWPATGRNFAQDPARSAAEPEQAYGWNVHGQRFQMPIHGFARDRAWAIDKSRSDPGRGRLVIVMTDGSDSLALYPFRFRFVLTYQVHAHGLEMQHHVIASSANGSAMPFTIGNHITFRQPLIPDPSRAAATITSPLDGHLELDGFGRPVRTEAIQPFNRKPLPTFAKQAAYSLTGAADHAWARWDDPSGLSLILRHRASRSTNAPPVLFNLWGDSDQGFFAIEPWFGRQNALASGVGVVRLAPGASFDWTFQLDVLDRAPKKPVRRKGMADDAMSGSKRDGDRHAS